MREPSQLVMSPESELLLKHDRCPSCALPKFKWKRTTKFRCCSPQCTEYFYSEIVIATSWNELRIKVFDRDNRQCEMCWKQFPYFELIADHIVPIALGGPQWDMKNIQTLCAIKCNKKKTKQDAHDIAKYRRENKIPKKFGGVKLRMLYHEAIMAGDLK